MDPAIASVLASKRQLREARVIEKRAATPAGIQLQQVEEKFEAKTSESALNAALTIAEPVTAAQVAPTLPAKAGFVKPGRWLKAHRAAVFADVEEIGQGFSATGFCS